MPTNFLDPVYYDINDIHPDAPNKPLLKELFERENAQNERLWEFFTEMIEDPQWKAMKAEAIKPRTLRKKRENRRKMAPRALPERVARKNSLSRRFLSTDGLRKGHPSVPETSSRRLRGALGSLRAAPGISRQRPRTYPRRFGDAPKARG